MSDQTYVCKQCGKQVDLKRGESIPICCDKPMEPLPYCTKIPNAEMDRLTDSDEPCADGTTPKKYRH
jgi:hypothetical protein